jgi:hypothetical protein
MENLLNVHTKEMAAEGLEKLTKTNGDDSKQTKKLILALKVLNEPLHMARNAAKLSVKTFPTKESQIKRGGWSAYCCLIKKYRRTWQ